jgi:hypothetical protein
MMELLRIYQNEGEQGLIKRRDSINNQQDDYRWIFPNVYLIPSLQNEEVSLKVEPIDVSAEMIEHVMNEPLPERKPPSRIIAEKDEKNPICIPDKANTIESTELSNTKLYPTDSSKVSNSDYSPSSRTITQISKESDNSRTKKSKTFISKADY